MVKTPQIGALPGCTPLGIPEKPKPSPQAFRLVKLAQAFRDRSEALGFKGKKRDELALEFFLGAAVGLDAGGNTDAAQHVLRVATLLIAVRGYSEIRRIAEGRAN